MKYKLMLLMELILGIPKSIYINFRYLPFKQAIRLPILVSYWCKLMTLHGNVRIEAPIKTGMIMLGVGAYGVIDHRYCRSLFTNSSGGGITFKGTARFGPGFKLANNGKLEIGNNFNMTGNSTIICEEEIIIGNDCLLSWEDLIMDTDYHSIIKDSEEKPKTKEIKLGNHVWVGCRATILKGVAIRNDSIIAAGSVVSSQFEKEGCLIGGMPSSVIKEQVNWKK